MKINKINLKSFGLFQNKDINFSAGINMIHGNNETGKSTMHKFIESMFFGMNEDYTQQRINNDDFMKYKPWENNSEYSGNMIYEHDGKTYCIERDFLKEENGVSISNPETGQDLSSDFEYDVIRKERKPLSRLNRMNFLSSLAISELSNKSARGLVQDIKNHIVNIKTSNSSIISVETAIKELTAKISTLKEESNIKKCYDAMSQLEVEMENDLQIQKDIKELGKKLFGYKRELIANQAQEKTILNRIRYKKYRALEEKYNNLCILKKEIELINEEIESLDVLANIERKDVDVYLDKNDQIEDYNQQNQQKRNELIQTKAQMKALNLDIPMEAISSLADDIYVGDFINDITIHLHQTEDIKNTDDRIRQYKEIVDKNSLTDDNAQVDLLTEEEKLERNYYKAINLDNTIKQIEGTENNDKELSQQLHAITAQKKKNVNNIQFLILFVVLLGMAITGFILLPNLTVIFGSLSGCFFAGAIAFAILFLLSNQELNSMNYLHQHLQEEKTKAEKRLHDNNQKLMVILDKYGCVSREELDGYYNKKKQSKKNDFNVYDELAILEQKREIMVYQENIQERRVLKWIKDTSVSQIIRISDGYEAITKLRELSKLCMRYMKFESTTYKLDSEITSIQKLIQGILDQIQSNPSFADLRIHSVEDIRKKKALYNQLHEKRTQVNDERKKLMLGQTEEDLYGKLVEEKNCVQGYEFENADQITVDELNEMHMKVKDVIIVLFQKINDLHNKISLKENRNKKSADIQREYKYYSKQIVHHQKKIENYEETLVAVKRVAKQITEEYSHELDDAIGEIVFKITNKYDQIVFDEEEKVLVRDKKSKKLVQAEKLSLGAIDQIYFAIRAGLVHSLHNHIEIPLVLDDCFSNYDNDRLERVLTEISKLNRQILIFSCQEREMSILSKMKVQYNTVELK